MSEVINLSMKAKIMLVKVMFWIKIFSTAAHYVQKLH